MSHKKALRAAAVAVSALFAVGALAACSPGTSSGGDEQIGMTLITTSTTNPYMVAMLDSGKKTAEELGITLNTGEAEGFFDVEAQVQGVENAISRGDKAVVILTASDGVNAALKSARDAGLIVMTLDAVPTPLETSDMTFGTDTRLGGENLGKWAAASLQGADAKLAMINFSADPHPADTERRAGFFAGFGIETNDQGIGNVGPVSTSGTYTGGVGGHYDLVCDDLGLSTVEDSRTAMENCLTRQPDVNIVYAINEPTSQGVYEAVDAAGLTDQIKIVAMDGSCSGVKAVEDGLIAANSSQSPGGMASMAIEAAYKMITEDVKPSPKPGQHFINTGTQLITNNPQDGVDSVDTAAAAKFCWGK